MFKLKRLTYAMGCVFVLNGCASSFQSKSVSTDDFEIKPVTQINHAKGGPKIMYMLGRYYQGKVNYVKAIEAYQKALDKNPEYVEVHNGLGVIYSIQGKHELALQHFMKALQLAPEETYLHNNLGFAYLLQGRESDAAESLRQALRFDPANQRARSNLAVTFDRLGLHDEAEMLRLAISPSIEKEVVNIPAGSDQSTNVAENDIKKTLLQANRTIVDARLEQMSPNVWEYRSVQQDPIITVLANEMQSDIKQSYVDKVVSSTPTASVNQNTARIEISNGNGVTGMAKRISSFLESKGLSKSRLTNQPSFRKPHTEILYRPGNLDLADQVSKLMPEKVRLVKSSDMRHDIQVKIILGQDYSQKMAYFKDSSKVNISRSKLGSVAVKSN